MKVDALFPIRIGLSILRISFSARLTDFEWKTALRLRCGSVSLDA